MSGANLDNIPKDYSAPQHRVHDPNEPLTGRRTDWDQQQSGVQYSTEGVPAHAQGQNAFNSERPLNVQPTSAGGVARDGQADLPVGEANLLDKVIGKTEKVIGKITRNADMHEAGELREAGGKKAVTGEARAPHD